MQEAPAAQVERILAAVGYLAEFLDAEDWRSHSPDMLRALGEGAGVDRAYLFDCFSGEEGRLTTSQTCEWVRGGVSQQIDNPALQNVVMEDVGFGSWEGRLCSGETITAVASEMTGTRKAALAEMQGILSIAVVPIRLGDELVGFVGFDDCHEERVWSDAETTALRAAGNMFAALQCRDRATKLAASLQEALDEIQVLRGIMPICSHCKRIRDEAGRWVVLDVYLRKCAGTDFSHGICEDCLSDMYPE